MRVWFVQGEQDRESDALEKLLRQWVGRPENSSWSVECLPGTKAPARMQTCPSDIVVLSEPCCSAESWLTGILERGSGLVVATTRERAEPYLLLAERYAVQLTPLPATLESLSLALLSLLSALQRQRSWQARIDQLQQRLNDRILVERAKGILVERLAISEKEAYQRLRLQSRRQRRPIRDVAQGLLDAQLLFSPSKNTFVDLPNLPGQAVGENPNEDA